MRFKFLVMALIATLLLASGSHVAAQSKPRYKLVDVGTLQIKGSTPEPGCIGQRGAVTDINDNGEIVGFLPKDETRGNAFYFNGEKMRRLKGDSGGSTASALNNDGLIVGVVYREIREDECSTGASPW